jgi:hypothetical protein
VDNRGTLTRRSATLPHRGTRHRTGRFRRGRVWTAPTRVWSTPTRGLDGAHPGAPPTFNLHPTQHVHLVWHNGVVLRDPAGLLEGSYPDRRMTYFTSVAEVEARRPALEDLVRQWVELMDREG